MPVHEVIDAGRTSVSDDSDSETPTKELPRAVKQE